MKKILLKIMGILLLTLCIYYIESTILREEFSQQVRVVIAKDTIARDTIISSDMVRIVEMPKQYIFQTYVNEKEPLVDKLATHDIEKGQIIGRGDYKMIKDAYRNQPARASNRLVMKRFNKNDGNSFLLEKGQIIDLVYVPKRDEDQGGKIIKDVIVRGLYDENFIEIEDNYDYRSIDNIYVCFEMTAVNDYFLKENSDKGYVKISIKRKE